jgi:hypothetical protein
MSFLPSVHGTWKTTSSDKKIDIKKFKMKKTVKIAAIAAMMLIPFGIANAQVSFGVKAGGTLSTQSSLGELWNNDGIRQGVFAGATVDYRISGGFSLMTELNYIEKGMKYDIYASSNTYNVSRKYEYLNIPLVAKGTFTNRLGVSEPFSVFGYAGPYYSVLLSSNDKFNGNEPAVSVNLESSAKSSDLGAVAGFGVSYKLPKKGELYIDLRYEMGLISIDKNDNDLRNKTMEAGIGFRF